MYVFMCVVVSASHVCGHGCVVRFAIFHTVAILLLDDIFIPECPDPLTRLDCGQGDR